MWDYRGGVRPSTRIHIRYKYHLLLAATLVSGHKPSWNSTRLCGCVALFNLPFAMESTGAPLGSDGALSKERRNLVEQKNCRMRMRMRMRIGTSKFTQLMQGKCGGCQPPVRLGPKKCLPVQDAG